MFLEYVRLLRAGIQPDFSFYYMLSIALILLTVVTIVYIGYKLKKEIGAIVAILVCGFFFLYMNDLLWILFWYFIWGFNSTEWELVFSGNISQESQSLKFYRISQLLLINLKVQIQSMRKEFAQDIQASTLDRNDRRSGNQRRKFSYTAHIPERRFSENRRIGKERRRKPRISGWFYLF